MGDGSGTLRGRCGRRRLFELGFLFEERGERNNLHVDQLLDVHVGQAGFEVLSQEANHDAKLQNDQIKNMVTQGAKVIIVVAEDGDSAATAVEDVAKKGATPLVVADGAGQPADCSAPLVSGSRVWPVFFAFSGTWMLWSGKIAPGSSCDETHYCVFCSFLACYTIRQRCRISSRCCVDNASKYGFRRVAVRCMTLSSSEKVAT